MSDSVQIEIPSFDDDDEFATTPIPFGRPQNFQQPFHFGSLPSSGGINPNFQDSDDHNSIAHVRGDSYTSESSSFGHVRPLLQPAAPRSQQGGHVVSPSLATSTYSVPSRKTSFASIKNAFKSAKTITTPLDAPPVPVLDHTSYPVLRNPFNRSGSARAVATNLATAPPGISTNLLPRRRPSAPSPSPSYGTSQSPQIPSAMTSQTGPAPAHARAKSSIPARRTAHGAGNHSPTSSTAHSDAAVDGGFYMPRAPGNGTTSLHRPAPSFVSDTLEEVEPSTPAEFALNVILMGFVTSAESHIEFLLLKPLGDEASIVLQMGPGVKPDFDNHLESLGRVALKQAKLVIDALTRWKKSQNNDGIFPDPVMRKYMTEHVDRAKRLDIRERLTRRREAASTYAYCRALASVISNTGKDSLDDLFANTLEATIFSEFVRSQDIQGTHSSNQRANADMFSVILGLLGKSRFISVTDRFLRELQPIASGIVQRDGDKRFEGLVGGLRSIEITVWPPERFDECAEFLEGLAKCFNGAHGPKLKSVFAETLTYMLHPIGKDARSDVNHPQWAPAVEVIYSKALAMMVKPRYWSTAYPLAITSLCVASEEYFLKHWVALCDLSFPKLKERSLRQMVYNGLVRLMWTYLYRCKESNSVTSNKLDALMRQLFPPGRRLYDDSTEPLTYIVHFILSRHNFDYGHDLIMELVQENVIMHIPDTSNLYEVVTPERVVIGVRAAMLSLSCLAKDTHPAWPSSADFTTSLSSADYPFEAISLPSEIAERPEISSLVERFGPLVAKLAKISMRSVGQMSVNDTRFRFDASIPYDEREQLAIRHHPDGIITSFPRVTIPLLDLLRSCFDAWPRCLHPSISLLDSMSAAIRSVAHADPDVGQAAKQCLLRFSSDERFASLVLRHYCRSLFSSSNSSAEMNWQVATEYTVRVELWVKLVCAWTEGGGKGKEDGEPDTSSQSSIDPSVPAIFASALMEDVEAGALFLLTSTHSSIRLSGIAALRAVAPLRNTTATTRSPSSPSSILELLSGSVIAVPMPTKGSLMMSDSEGPRMAKWRDSKLPDYLLRLLESDNPLDHALWHSMIPTVMRTCMTLFPSVLNRCRNSLSVAVLRSHSTMSTLAGMTSKVTLPSAATSRGPLAPARSPNTASHEITHEQRNDVVQWRAWIMALCACAMPIEDRARTTQSHSRVSSEMNGAQERISTAKGLFRLLIPFLASEFTLFRDAAVSALGSTNASSFKTLLDDLRTVTAHIYDDGKSVGLSKTGLRRTNEQDRVHLAVVRVYALTAGHINDGNIQQDETTVTLLWNFVSATQSFLTRPDIRIDWEMGRLRRYFCYIVEKLFSVSYQHLRNTIPEVAYLSLYRLCDEWCPWGPSGAWRELHSATESSIVSNHRSVLDRTRVTDRFHEEENILAAAAASAMSTICVGAFYHPLIDFVQPQSQPAQLSVSELVEWISALLSHEAESVTLSGRKALHALLVDPRYSADLMHAIVRRSFISSSTLSSTLFFKEAMHGISMAPLHHFSFHQSLWLGLVHLGRADVETRCQAFNALRELHLSSAPTPMIARLQSAIRSTAPNVYVQAQQQVSSILASANPQAASGVLAECTLRLPQSRDGQERLALLCLQHWIPHAIILGDDGKLSVDGHGALYNLISLTVRYGDAHADVLQLLWSLLIEEERALYCKPIIDFLVQEAVVRSNPAFVVSARKIVAYLSRTPLGPAIFDHLCGILEPGSMLVSTTVESSAPPGEDTYFVENLDGLLPVPKTRQHLSRAELAVAYMSDSIPNSPWEHDNQLPTLLHVVIMLVDHRNIYVRSQMRRYLFQILRGWCTGYFRIPEQERDEVEVYKLIDEMEGNPDIFWSHTSKSAADLAPKLQRLCGAVLRVLRPLCPDIEQYWAVTALMWGNRCPVRDSACRSLQIFQVLSITPQPYMAVDMMERLSSTISDLESADLRFAKEIILTLTEYSRSNALTTDGRAALFWCATASLSTAVESEFQLAVSFMVAVLDGLDIKDPGMVELIRACKPLDWSGTELAVERLVFAGLRSSETLDATFGLLGRVVEAAGHDVVESNDSRLRHVYTACLPWALHSIENGIIDDRLVRLATSLATLAASEDCDQISRIMTSVAKNRFKRKEDFLRQAATALRDTFWGDHATDILMILIGCVLNKETWLRSKSLQILKAVLQNINSAEPFQLAGSEMLLPLLRLLSGELASEAMEVLETPMVITGGPPAAHVVRMSMHLLAAHEPSAKIVVFGSPAESGWCVASPADQSRQCRHNVYAVVSASLATVKHPSGTMTNILFAHDEELPSSRSDQDVVAHRSQPSADEASLGELVNTLHDLSTFFQSDIPMQPPVPIDDTSQHTAERRVANILSRALAKPNHTDVFAGNGAPYGASDDWIIPPTPFIDLFAAPPSLTASDAVQRNFMRTAEESDGEDEEDESRSDVAHGHGHGHNRSSATYDRSFPSRQTTPRSRMANGSREIWDSDEEDSSFAVELSTAAERPPRRTSVSKVKDLLNTRRSPKQDRARRV